MSILIQVKDKSLSIQSLLKNKGIWTFADQGMVSLANFCLGILLARTLGVEGFGIYSLIWMFVLFFNNIQSALIIAPMMSIGPKQVSTKVNDYYGGVFITQLIYSIFSVVLIFIVFVFCSIFNLSIKIDEYLLPLILITFSFQLQEFFRKYYMTIGKTRSAFLLDFICYSGQLITIFILNELYTINVKNILLLFSIFYFISVLLGGALGFTISFNKKFIRESIGRNLVFGKWMTLANLTQWLGSQGVLVIGGIFLGPTSLGGVRAVLNLMSPINMIMVALQNILPMKASKIFVANGKVELKRFLTKIIFAASPVILVIGVASVLFGKYLLGLLYGEEFEIYANLVFLLFLYALLGTLIVTISIYYRTIEKTNLLAIANFIASPISILISIILLMFFNEVSIMVSLLANNLIIFLFLIKDNFSKSLFKGQT